MECILVDWPHEKPSDDRVGAAPALSFPTSICFLPIARTMFSILRPMNLRRRQGWRLNQEIRFGHSIRDLSTPRSGSSRRWTAYWAHDRQVKQLAQSPDHGVDLLRSIQKHPFFQPGAVRFPFEKGYPGRCYEMPASRRNRCNSQAGLEKTGRISQAFGPRAGCLEFRSGAERATWRSKWERDVRARVVASDGQHRRKVTALVVCRGGGSCPLRRFAGS